MDYLSAKLPKKLLVPKKRCLVGLVVCGYLGLDFLLDKRSYKRIILRCLERSLKPIEAFIKSVRELATIRRGVGFHLSPVLLQISTITSLHMVTMAIELLTTSLVIRRLQNDDIPMGEPPINDSGFSIFRFWHIFHQLQGEQGGREEWQ